jgi:DNA-directed RNA polymerase subunit RPC12/RpoP
MKCPVCGSPLRHLHSENGVRCAYCFYDLCSFNFQDQSCAICGENAWTVRNHDNGKYEVECKNGHAWICD